MFHRTPLLKLLCAASMLLTACFSAQANAQAAYPTKPLTFVVPYAAGGAADVFVRNLAHKLSERLKVPVVVENKPGANGNIGSAAVAKGPADGYTLLLGTSSTITINPHLYGHSMSYDPIKDLQPVTLMHVMSNVLVVNPQTPFRTVSDVVAEAKAKPASLHFGSPGNGNTMHLAAELFKTQSGINMVHVPYKSGPNALTDVVAGHIPLMFNNLPAVVDMIKSGKLRALAVTSRTRSGKLPGVPTMVEAGVPDYESTVWSGVMVRAGTPVAIVQLLNKEIKAILETPSFRQPLEDQGYVVTTNTPKEFSALIAADLKVWGKVVKDSGARVD
jgi:tripartite-type tricarboxylate transporter receptor subunit TctC